MKMNRPPLGQRVVRPGRAVADVDRLELDVAVNGGDLGPELDCDVRLPANLVHEVLGHALLERVAAADDGHRARVIGEEQRRLAGRVARADDVDVEPVRARRLAARRAVEDALADQRLDAGDREVPPRHAGGQDDRAPAQLVASVEADGARAGSRPVIARVTRISAPSRRACCSARLLSSSPETPAGKPR